MRITDLEFIELVGLSGWLPYLLRVWQVLWHRVNIIGIRQVFVALDLRDLGSVLCSATDFLRDLGQVT